MSAAPAARPAGGRPALLLGGLGLCLLGYVLTMPPDVAEYLRYAQRFWFGRPPLHALPVEYPPASLLAFSTTLLGPRSLFPLPFLLLMALALVAMHALLLKWRGPRHAAALLVYLYAGCAATLLGRYDLLPALATVAALGLAGRRHYTTAYLLLAAGILLKLYPVALIPVVAISEVRDGGRPWRRLPRSLAPAAILLAAGFGAALALSPAATAGPFLYALGRPPEVESLPATVVWLGTLAGVPASAVVSFGSQNLSGPLAGPATLLGSLAGLAALAWTYWCQLRGGLGLGRAFVVAVGVTLCTAKVLSAQYLIWLLPLVAWEIGFDWRWLGLSLLTTLAYPLLWGLDVAAQPGEARMNAVFFAVLAGRNLLLAVLVARCAAEGARAEVAPVPAAPAPAQGLA